MHSTRSLLHNSKDHAVTLTVSPEAALSLWNDNIQNVLDIAVPDDLCHDLASNTQQWYSTVTGT